MKRSCRCRALVLLLLWSACQLLFLLPSAAAEERRTVTVGYNDLPGFLYQATDGSYQGFGYELLQGIGSYCDWVIRYVKVPYSDIGEKLNSGEIDLFVPHQRTEERAALFEYSTEVFSTNQASLLTRPDADLYYDDFDRFDGLRVGVEKGTRNGERYLQLFAEKAALSRW